MKNYRVRPTHWLISTQLPEEPEEVESKEPDAVLDIDDGVDDEVVVFTVEEKVPVIDKSGVGSLGIDPESDFLEVLRSATTVMKGGEFGLLGVPFSDVIQNNMDFEQGMEEVEELVPDDVLGNAQDFYDWLSTLKVTPSRARLASSSAVWKSTSASGTPGNSSLSHFSATTRPCWLNRVVRDPRCRAVELASRRWRENAP